MPRFAWRPVTAVAAAVAALLLATITRYGYHRDELYFRLLGEHPAWGYVDQPPATPLIARAAIEVFGDYRVGASGCRRVLCVVATAFLAALVAREFGGGAGAQALAAAGARLGVPAGRRPRPAHRDARPGGVGGVRAVRRPGAAARRAALVARGRRGGRAGPVQQAARGAAADRARRRAAAGRAALGAALGLAVGGCGAGRWCWARRT